MAPVWLGDRGSEEFLKNSNSWGLSREGILKLRFDFEIPSKITCRLYFIYSSFMFSFFFSGYASRDKNDVSGQNWLEFEQINFVFFAR